MVPAHGGGRACVTLRGRTMPAHVPSPKVSRGPVRPERAFSSTVKTVELGGVICCMPATGTPFIDRIDRLCYFRVSTGKHLRQNGLKNIERVIDVGTSNIIDVTACVPHPFDGE